MDYFVTNGKKDKKVNLPEAQALVGWLKENLRNDPALRDATVGIISLGGAEQARVLCKVVLDQFTDIEIARHKIVTGDPSLWQGDERDVILLSLVASPGERYTVKGKEAEQKYNVALSRARDRMVLFRSIGPKDISNPDDLRLWTMQFFQRQGRSLPPPSSKAARPKAANGRASTLGDQICDWLAQRGFRFATDCAVAGAVAIVEDATDDQRLCVCLDGSAGATLSGWLEERRAQIALEREGWHFHRIWQASWLVDRERCEAALAARLAEVSIQPPTGGGGSSSAAAAAAASTPTVVVAAPPPPALKAEKRKGKATADETEEIHGTTAMAGSQKRPKAGSSDSAAAAPAAADNDAEAQAPSAGKERKQPAATTSLLPKPSAKAHMDKKEPKAKKEPTPAKKKDKRKRGDDSEWEPGDD